ncbi:hypothetical protein NDN08_005944 [Rhodosorus marinus]|uniref:mRNA (guanine-N(7))-methyltransferase n=1 Tax=Rhodosorus marinus TaxID=101924 RepID=A0AAV8UJT9_9RHOD|nr:hypothetical protein NDN08_005944 [Rhodosorus marinus]
MDSEAVASFYNERVNDKTERRTSRILRMRNFNNWVKAVLIQLHTRPNYSVLDLACGKGGDLLKWDSAGVTLYVGCDIARVSLEQAIERYQNMRKVKFDAMFLHGDCFSARVERYLSDEAMFDVVSSQFAIHYAFENEKRVRRLLENVSSRLKPGGFFIGTTPDANVLIRKLRAVEGLEFGNSIFNMAFDGPDKYFPRDKSPWGIRYRFTLDENVMDTPEFLVHFPTFQKIAAEYDLELRLLMNFHQFYLEFIKVPEFLEIYERLKVVGQHGITYDEWDAIFLYTAFVFQKRGGSPDPGLDRSDIEPIEKPEETLIHEMEDEDD